MIPKTSNLATNAILVPDSAVYQQFGLQTYQLRETQYHYIRHIILHLFTILIT